MARKKPPPGAAPAPEPRKRPPIGEVASSLAADMAALGLSTADSDGIVIRIPGVISTRCPTLDAAIGRGGIPLSRMTVLTGGESVGKSTLSCHVIAEAQSMGGVALYLDTERKLDLDYAASLGVDLKSLLMPPAPPALEGCLEIIGKTAKVVHARAPGKPFVAVIDSMNASRTEDEYESESYSPAPGGIAQQARVMSSGLPKLLQEIEGTTTALLFVSQPRDAGMGSGRPHKEKVACGNAPKHYAALIIDMYRAEWLKESEKQVGSVVKATCIKNQVAKPFGEAVMHLRWGEGFDFHHGLITRGIDLLLVNSSTSGWFEMPFNGEVIKWQGMKGFRKQVLEKRPDALEYLRARVANPEPRP